ncbi:GNAT family N-acetyltransferase [bacterium]|nr:MAG: GNAT family N-acetyltransferase [bacterium]
MTVQISESSVTSRATLPADWLSQVIIRTLEERDLPALEWDGEYAHFRRLFADSFHRQKSGFSMMWVAELPETGIIGQVFIQFICDRHELADGLYKAYLYSFRVKPAYRSAGLGGKLLAAVEADLKKRHFHRITLNVAKTNVRARQMYERHGFRVVANESGCWSYIDHEGNRRHVEEPAWRMEKSIP